MTPLQPCRVFSYVDFGYIREIRDVRQILPQKTEVIWEWNDFFSSNAPSFGHVSEVGLGLKNMSNPIENKQESIPWATNIRNNCFLVRMAWTNVLQTPRPFCMFLLWRVHVSVYHRWPVDRYVGT